MDETICVSILEHLSRVAAIARASSLAINNHLGIKANRGLRADTVHDIESIGNCRSRGLGPAGATVLRDMLVLVPRQIVSAVLVSPVDSFGKVFDVMELPASRSIDFLTSDKFRLANAAALPAWKELLWLEVTSLWVKLWLREWIHSCVIVRIVLLLFCSLMPDLLGPSISGSSPGAARLNRDVIDTLANAEESLLTPLGTPGVTHIPELLAILCFSPTNNGDFVSGVQITRVVTVDATSIIIERLWHSNTTSNGTALVDFLHHIVFPRDEVVFINTVHSVLIWNEASLPRVAVAAHVHRAANLTVVVTSSSVDRACLIGDFILRHPFKSMHVEATVATLVLHLA